MHILVAIIVGFIVGLIARALMPGPNPLGMILTTLLGIGGAFIGQFLGVFFGLYQRDEPAGFFMSVIGAIILLFIFSAYKRRNVP